MSIVTQVYLVESSQSSGWQAKNTVQCIGDDIYIVVKINENDSSRQIQQAARKIEQQGVENPQLVGELWNEQTQWAFVLGFTCVDKLTSIAFCGADQEQQFLNDKLAVYAWSRNLTNQTPADLYPIKLAQTAIDFLTEISPQSISTNLIKGEALKSAGWTGIYNVGKGSEHEPCLLEVDFNPSGCLDEEVNTCLVGKGITFDSGGYSIKSSAGMFDMKCDMGGAAVVAGALGLAIKQGLNKRTKLFLCCAENMVSSNAFKLGDILTYNNGVTVEIANTDAEGRLVLADGLLAASANKPNMLIDAATLTGAAMAATGGEYTAFFSLDQTLAEHTKKVAEQVNEPLWQLPLAPWHQQKCSSAFANTANSSTQKGGGMGGASNAAGFLSRFVENNGEGWLHFDLSAAYNGSSNALWSAGATGLGIALMAKLIND